MFEKYQKICSKSDSTVDGIDAWYFEEVKKREIHALQMKADRTKKKKEARRLLRNLASASLEDQAKLIQFHRVGRDEELRYEHVAKEIADKDKELEDDEARLPRRLTFHLSFESQRQVAAQNSVTNPQVRCTHNESTQIADYECQVCHEHALCRKCCRQNATERHKEYRTIRPCTYCKKNPHTKCMRDVQVGTDYRLACDTCRGWN